MKPTVPTRACIQSTSGRALAHPSTVKCLKAVIDHGREALRRLERDGFIRAAAVAAVSSLLFCGCQSRRPPAPPDAAPVIEDYHGIQISDPYRHLENLKDPAVDSWYRAQGEFARETLDGIPGRSKVLAQLREFDSRKSDARRFRYAPDTGEFTPEQLSTLPEYPEFSELEVEELMIPSHDQTLVPLSVIRQRSTPRDGNAPLMLLGYGAYGISENPQFSSAFLVWTLHGGTFAVAHVRGGGELFESHIQELYPKMGIQFLIELRRRFPAAGSEKEIPTPQPVSPEEVLAELETFAPGFESWTEGFRN